jgi:hypothetical protein
MKTSIPTVVYQYVVDCPGCTSRDIIADLDLRPQTVRMTLKRFQQQGLLITSGMDTNGLKFWYLPGSPVPVKERFVPLKQETVTSWPACKVEQQNPFSALFLTK